MASDVFNIIGTLQAGAFRVEAVVAEGGFAVIYRAHHQGFRADVALKCLKLPETLAEDRRYEFLQNFRAEAELLFTLAVIPAFVRPLHVGQIENGSDRFIPFIAMEWLRGETLGKIVAKRRAAGKAPLSVRRAVTLLGPAARALERAHKFPSPNGTLSILHRDLKPENLFVAELHGQHSVKILDFGIAKTKEKHMQVVGRMSTDGAQYSAFTPAYAAPEQWLPKRYGQTGPWTDVWGLAITLVEVLLGRPPLAGDAPAIMGAALDKSERPTPGALGAKVDERLQRVFEKALAVDPGDRYGDMGAFWDDLERIAGVHTPRLADSPSALQSMAPPAGSYPPGNLSGAPGATAAAEALARLPTAGPGLDILSLAEDPGPRAFRPRAAASAVADSRRRALRQQSEGALIMRRFAGPLRLLVLAVAIVALDWGFTLVRKEPFTIGPFRVFWIAAPLVAVGIARLVYTLISEGSPSD